MGLGKHSAPRRPRTPLAATRGSAPLGGSAALAVALTGLTPLAAQAASATAVAEDGCGRVDSVHIEGVSGTYYIEIPDATMDGPLDARGKPTKIPAEYEVDVINGEGTWARKSDAISDAATKGLPFRVLAPWNNDAREHVRVTGASARGTDTFVLTNEDCVEPEEPTFDDLPGKANDTLTVPTTTGVVYSPKSGMQPGKGTVTVTATAAKGYRLADEDGTPIPLSQTRWTHTFDPSRTVAAPDTAAPTFKLAEPPEPGAKTTKPNPNVVVVTAVDGITWIVDGKPVKADAKTPLVEVPIGTKTKVVVTATPVDRETVLDGRTTWTVTEATRMPLPKKPAIVAPLHEAGIGRRSVVRWAPPYLSKDRFTYDVQFRTAPTRNAWGEEIPTTWRPWLAGTKALSANLSGLPGGVYQVRISARRAGIEATPWTSPTTVYVLLDVTSGPRGWVRTPDKTAIGGTLVGTTRAGASWSVRTAKTDKVLLWFATGPLGPTGRGRP